MRDARAAAVPSPCPAEGGDVRGAAGGEPKPGEGAARKGSGDGRPVPRQGRPAQARGGTGDRAGRVPPERGTGRPRAAGPRPQGSGRPAQKRKPAQGRPPAAKTPADGEARRGLGGGPARPLAVTGMVGAAWCVGLGLVVLTTVTLVGWIAAPRTGLGEGLPGVFRTAVNFWLVSHHAGFSVPSGRVGLLPLGLILLPGGLLYRSGGWVIRAAESRYRQRVGVVQVSLLLAAPYATFAVMLALIARTPALRPSPGEAFVACFSLAFVAGGLGAARALSASRGKVRSGVGALLRLLPDRPRSVVMGLLGAMAVLIASGALLIGSSLALHHREAGDVYALLAPGAVGGALLILVEIAYLPNAVIWGMAFAVGPGFSVGAGTSVSPTGVFLGALPSFPPLAALPQPGPAPLLSLLALLAPFAAGAVGGTLVVRAMPSTVPEAAPLWGFVSGVATGGVMFVLAALSGGPLGGGRMATMGPSPWQIGLLTALEVGLAAACAAWIANWWLLRDRPESERAERRRLKREAAAAPAVEEEPEPPAPAPRRPPNADPFAFVESEPILRRREP
ncbi:cell division protein PerM [Actinocorallia longicatena]|uniref:cell division protein PerM n=1 Tax=Actinocorallia longicatena TaxID=111803 RepID=UPI0031DAA081